MKSVSFRTSDGGTDASPVGGSNLPSNGGAGAGSHTPSNSAVGSAGKIHPEYAKLAEERLKAATVRRRACTSAAHAVSQDVLALKNSKQFSVFTTPNDPCLTSQARIVQLETDLQAARKQGAEEKFKTAKYEQEMAKLNDRIAQVRTTTTSITSETTTTTTTNNDDY